MNKLTYRRVVRASAFYDLVVALPFATPWTARFVLDCLAQLHDVMGVGGQPLPAFGPMHLLFVSFFGTIVTLWSLLRLRFPEPSNGLADAIARGFFSAWMVFAVAAGETRLLVGFLAVEVMWGVIQAAGYATLRASASPARTR